MALLLKIMTIIGLLVTTIMLLLGVIQMFNTNADVKKNNELMRWRVIFQTFTFLMFSALLIFGKN